MSVRPSYACVYLCAHTCTREHAFMLVPHGQLGLAWVGCLLPNALGVKYCGCLCSFGTSSNRVSEVFSSSPLSRKGKRPGGCAADLGVGAERAPGPVLRTHAPCPRAHRQGSDHPHSRDKSNDAGTQHAGPTRDKFGEEKGPPERSDTVQCWWEHTMVHRTVRWSHHRPHRPTPRSTAERTGRRGSNRPPGTPVTEAWYSGQREPRPRAITGWWASQQGPVTRRNAVSLRRESNSDQAAPRRAWETWRGVQQTRR